MKIFKRRPKKKGTIARYIDEVCDYEAAYERYNGGDYSYPPVVPKLLLSILISVKALTMVFPFLVCLLCCALLKIIFG